MQKEKMAIQTALEQQRLERHNVLLACKVQDIEVILLSGSLDEVIHMTVRRPGLGDSDSAPLLKGRLSPKRTHLTSVSPETRESLSFCLKTAARARSHKGLGSDPASDALPTSVFSSVRWGS